MSNLQGKRALITGGTTGIGFATAREFLSQGARVIITGNNSDTIAKAKAELGNDVIAIRADSAKVSQQQRLAEEVKSHFGNLDIAFINAGVSDWRPMQDFTEEAFDRQFAINVKGPFFLVQSLIPVFADPASVIMNGSVFAHTGTQRASVYSATKAAMLSFTKTMTSELLANGVRFNAISCAAVDTPLFDKLGIPDAYREQVTQSVTATIPAGRYGRPEEIAKAVAYLASDDSAWTVGSELVLDGGRLLNG